jgi:iron(III) transport system substrate-binding protein
VAQGQAKIALTDTDDVWVAQRNGWPVDLVYPRHGSAGTLLIPNTVARVRGGTHETEAAALIDFLLSEEVERFLAASDSHNIPIRPGLAREFPRYAVSSPMAVDYAKVAAVMTPAIRSVSGILGN